MPYGAQKDKEFPRLLCPCNNLLLFRAQRNRRVPHGSTPHRGRGTVLFHLSEHRCPSLSTLAGPLSKLLVNVLGGVVWLPEGHVRLGSHCGTGGGRAHASASQCVFASGTAHS